MSGIFDVNLSPSRTSNGVRGGRSPHWPRGGKEEKELGVPRGGTRWW